jgi:hypothetical protein
MGRLVAARFVAVFVLWRPVMRGIPKILVLAIRGWVAFAGIKATPLPPLNPV